jgi:CheY-like chemotaxis protein
LIEDLLEVSRIITGKLRIEFQPVTFASIVDAVINSLRPAADAKRLQLETAIDPTAGPILGDPARLQQIVTNVLSNAIKFTDDGGRVEIRLQRVDTYARLEIRDTGVGIAAKDLPHIFERFRQADSSNIRTHGGLGLGLAIVDYLVRQHGGAVYVESEGSGKGATFIIEFPVSSSELLASEVGRVELFSAPARLMLENSETFSEQRLKDLRILVVEDDADTRELLKTILERCGAEVRTVGSSDAAMAEIAKRIPDILISDIGMPGESGYDLMKQVRFTRAGARWPRAGSCTYRLCRRSRSPPRIARRISDPLGKTRRTRRTAGRDFHSEQSTPSLDGNSKARNALSVILAEFVQFETRESFA